MTVFSVRNLFGNLNLFKCRHNGSKSVQDGRKVGTRDALLDIDNDVYLNV